MPITLQKRSNILCLAAHFRLLGADRDPQSQKCCKKSEIFVFATGRSPRQERDPTKNAWTPLERAKAPPPQSKQAKPHEPARPTGQNLRKVQGPSNDGGAEPEKLTRIPARARETPAKPTRPPANGNRANLTKEGCDNRGPQGKTRKPQYRYGAQDKEGSAETSRRTLLKR